MSTVYQRDARKNYFYRLNQHAVVTVGPSIALLIDGDTGMLLAHGSPAFLAQKQERLIARRKEAGEAANIVLFDNARWDPTFLNHLIGADGACPAWWSKQVANGALATTSRRPH